MARKVDDLSKEEIRHRARMWERFCRIAFQLRNHANWRVTVSQEYKKMADVSTEDFMKFQGETFALQCACDKLERYAQEFLK